METMKMKEVPKFLESPTNWKTEAAIFLHSVMPGESFVLKNKKSINHMREYLNDYKGFYYSVKNGIKASEGIRFVCVKRIEKKS